MWSIRTVTGIVWTLLTISSKTLLHNLIQVLWEVGQSRISKWPSTNTHFSLWRRRRRAETHHLLSLFDLGATNKLPPMPLKCDSACDVSRHVSEFALLICGPTTQKSLIRYRCISGFNYPTCHTSLCLARCCYWGWHCGSAGGLRLLSCQSERGRAPETGPGWVGGCGPTSSAAGQTLEEGQGGEKKNKQPWSHSVAEWPNRRESCLWSCLLLSVTSCQFTSAGPFASHPPLQLCVCGCGWGGWGG